MEVANTLAYYDTATITYLNGWVVSASLPNSGRFGHQYQLPGLLACW
jgi:hypothetical protein